LLFAFSASPRLRGESGSFAADGLHSAQIRPISVHQR
jgi:hypothetical protein